MSLRKLQLPYYLLVQLWEAMQLEPSVYPAATLEGRRQREALFGKEREHDFLKQHVPHSNKFGPEDPRKELANPERIVARLALPEWVLVHIDAERDVGRYYDDQERVYMRAYKDNEWFVRLPFNSRNEKRIRNGDVFVSFPSVGEELVLHRRDETLSLVVFRVDGVSSRRQITASLRALE